MTTITTHRSARIWVSITLGAAVLAGCGSSSSSRQAGAYGTPASTTPAPTSAAVSSSAQRAGSQSAIVAAAGSKLGVILVDGTGRSLYLWHGDSGTHSNCSGDCAAAWPPFLTQAPPKAGHGVSATRLGTTRRSDGSLQATYDGHPLYTYVGDSGPGQTSGQGSTAFGAAWDVVPVGTATAVAARQGNSAASSSSW